MKGPHTEETKEKIRKTLKKKYKNGEYVPWMKGKTHTKKAKEKISKAGMGHIPWNKGIPTKLKRCSLCGIFMPKKGKHNCKWVNLRKRYCKECGILLNNKSERYTSMCGKCGKKAWREKERQQRKEVIKQFNGKCKRCGYSKFTECLEFHHLYKEDKKGPRFLKEVIKNPKRFWLVCNRCHREIHTKEQRNAR